MKNTNEEWKKRFNELVFSNEEYRSDVSPSDIKDFIRYELDTQRQAIYEEVITLVETSQKLTNEARCADAIEQIRNEFNKI